MNLQMSYLTVWTIMWIKDFAKRTRPVAYMNFDRTKRRHYFQPYLAKMADAH